MDTPVGAAGLRFDRHLIAANDATTDDARGFLLASACMSGSARSPLTAAWEAPACKRWLWPLLFALPWVLWARGVTNAGPALPDAALYLHTALQGEADLLVVTRYVGLAPLVVASWFGDDPYLVTRIHGLLVGLLGMGVIAWGARTFDLRAGALLCALLLYAGHVEISVGSGWVPLTDTTNGIVTGATFVAFVRWMRGRSSSWLLGALVVASLGTRISAVFLVAGLLLVAAREGVEARRIVRVVLWSLAFGIAYLFFVGWAVSGDPLWVFEAVGDMSRYYLDGKPPRSRKKSQTNLTLLVTRPELAGFAVLAVAAVRDLKRKEYTWALLVALGLLLGMELLHYVSPRLAAQSRRFAPVFFLLAIPAADYLVQKLGRAALIPALAIPLVFIAVSEELMLPLDPEQKRFFARQVVMLAFVATALVSFAAPGPYLLAWACMGTLAAGTAIEADARLRVIRWGDQVRRLRTDPARCPVAFARIDQPADWGLARANRLLNGECARIIPVPDRRALQVEEWTEAVSRFNHVPGSVTTEIPGPGRIYRHKRKRRAPLDEPAR